MAEKSYNIQLEIRNADVVAAAISKLPGTVRQVGGRKISLLAEHLKNAIIDETPKDTGKLARSTQLQKKTGLRYQIIQTATAEKRHIGGFFYGRAVRHGAKAPSGGRGIIKPRTAKALWWPGILGGRPVAMVNNHPGIKGSSITPYVFNALSKSQSEIAAVKQSIATEVTQQAARGFRTGKV